MSTLAHTSRPVNRVFGEGLLEEPVVTLDAKLATCLIECNPERWQAAVKLLALGLGYHSEAAAHAVRWMSSPRGRVDRCPSIERQHWAVFNATKAEADRKPFADAPTDDDRAWWAANSPANRRGYSVVRRPAARPLPTPPEAVRALEGVRLGLIPAELAEAVMARSLVGHEG